MKPMRKNNMFPAAHARGQALVELALILPILIMLIIGSIEFGTGFYFKNKAINIARDVVRYAVVTPSLTEAKITTYFNDKKYNEAGFSIQSTTGVPPTSGGSVTVTVHRTVPYNSTLARFIPGFPNTHNISASATMRYEQ